MFKSLSKFPEWRVVGFLSIIALSWYLLSIFSYLLGYISDILIVVILSWIFAFIIEPLVEILIKRGLSRLTSTSLTFIGIAIALVAFLVIVLPQTVNQLSQLSTTLPQSLPQNSPLTPRLEEFVSSSINNSLVLVTQAASAVTGLVLVFVLSFYFVLSRKEISQFILKIIPDKYEDDFGFLEKTINESFAVFLRVQFFIGLTIGAITYITMTLLGVPFALSTSLISGIFAIIPIIGAIVAVIPPALSALTVSPNLALITMAIITIASQLVYNILAPKLLGNAFKIHPIVIILSFVMGYKIFGTWGAIFAIPVVGAASLVAKDLLKYWKEEADK
jgi:predicted PurR-regulated permease PerM